MRDRFSNEEWSELADLVVDRVHALLGSTSFDASQIVMPDLNHDNCVALLDSISNRARNALQRNFGLALEGLRGIRVSALLEIRNFGTRCLLEVLTALDALDLVQRTEPHHGPPVAPSREAVRARVLLETAVALTSLGPRALAITRNDRRFGHFVEALSADATTLRDIADDTRLIRPRLHSDKLKTILAELDGALQAARSLTLTEEISTLLNPKAIPTRDAALRRLGLLGDGPLTLQAAGDQIGVTRERIRQIQEKLRRALEARPYMPAFAAALAAANSAVMTGARRVSDVEAEMRASGAIGSQDSVAQVVRLAKLRQVPSCEIDSHFGGQLVGFANHFQRLLKAAALASDLVEEETKKHGACPVAAVADALIERGYVAEAEPERLSVLATTMPGVDIITVNGRDWLSYRGRAYTIATMAKKILSISPSIRIAELRRGLQRHHRIRTVPPSAVLGRVLVTELSSIGLVFDGDLVFAGSILSAEEILSPTEFAFYSVLRKCDGVMARSELFSKLKDDGVKVGTITMMLSHSPLLESYGRGVYGLRGVPATPGQVEALAAEYVRPRRELHREYGHLPDGRPWLTRELSEYELDHRTLYLPTGARQYVPDGDYRVRLEGSETPYVLGISVGQIRCKNNMLEAAGAEPSDYVLFVFDRNKRSVDVSVGDRDVASKLLESDPAGGDAENNDKSLESSLS